MRDQKAGSRRSGFAVERLDVYRVALELLRLVEGLGPRLWRRNSALCRQLQRAVASVVANIGEAAGCFTTGDRRRYFEYAYRSAGECASLIIAFESLHHLAPHEAAELRQVLTRTQIMLRRLIEKASAPPKAADASPP